MPHGLLPTQSVLCILAHLSRRSGFSPFNDTHSPLFVTKETGQRNSKRVLQIASQGMDKDYKLRKEAFVADLSGGSITEINLVTLVAPVWPTKMRPQFDVRLADLSRRRRCCGRSYSRDKAFSETMD